MTTSDEPSTTSTPISPPADSEENISEQPEAVLNKYDPHKWKEEEREERRNNVWKLSIVDRMSQRDIAKQLGVSVYTVNQDIKWVAKTRVKNMAEADRAFVVEQDSIYGALLTKWLSIALAEGDTSPASHKATDHVARILGDQAKLHGFGQAGKVSPKEAGEVMGEYVLKAMQAMAHGNVIEGEIIQPALKDATQSP
jgi:hypothetical protein